MALTLNRFHIPSIHPAEIFPLVLCVGIVIQGVTFAGVQGTGLKSLFLKDCESIAQFMWPGTDLIPRRGLMADDLALFIVPYIQVIFCLECAIRSLRASPFQPRGKYDVAVCCGTIVLMLIATWI